MLSRPIQQKTFGRSEHCVARARLGFTIHVPTKLDIGNGSPWIPLLIHVQLMARWQKAQKWQGFFITQNVESVAAAFEDDGGSHQAGLVAEDESAAMPRPPNEPITAFSDDAQNAAATILKCKLYQRPDQRLFVPWAHDSHIWTYWHLRSTPVCVAYWEHILWNLIELVTLSGKQEHCRALKMAAQRKKILLSRRSQQIWIGQSQVIIGYNVFPLVNIFW